MLTGSGSIGNLPDKAEAAITKQYEYGLEIALERFKEDYKETAGIPEDKINYNDLYEMGKSDLAEKLSEMENDENSDDQSTVMFLVRAMFEAPNSMTVQVVCNWEAPYHRSQDKFEDYKQETFEFTDAKDLKKQLTDALNKGLQHMGCKTISESVGEAVNESEKKSFADASPIETVGEFEEALKASHSWPGLYPKYFVTADNGILSFDAAKAEQELVKSAIADKGSDKQWEVSYVAINFENPDLVCDHTERNRVRLLR